MRRVRRFTAVAANSPNIAYAVGTGGAPVIGDVFLLEDGASFSGTIAAAANGSNTITYTVVSGAAPVINDTLNIGIDFGFGSEQFAVTAVAGAGPFVLTLSGALQRDHGPGTPVSDGNTEAVLVNGVMGAGPYTLTLGSNTRFTHGAGTVAVPVSLRYQSVYNLGNLTRRACLRLP